MLGRETALGAVVSPPASRDDIARAAFVLGRSVSYNELRRAVRSDMPPNGDTASLPPRSRGSKNHAIWLLCGMRATAHDLGDGKQTALSKLGPGCSGSLHSLADHSTARTTASVATGDDALFRHPFSEDERKPKGKPKGKSKGKRGAAAKPEAPPPPPVHEAAHCTTTTATRKATHHRSPRWTRRPRNTRPTSRSASSTRRAASATRQTQPPSTTSSRTARTRGWSTRARR